MEKVVKKELLDDIAVRIADVDAKRSELKALMAAESDEQTKQQAEKVLFEMNKIRDSLQLQYNQLEDDLTNDEDRMKELENNIYNNLRSFDNAFKNAGAIFRGPRR